MNRQLLNGPCTLFCRVIVCGASCSCAHSCLVVSAVPNQLTIIKAYNMSYTKVQDWGLYIGDKKTARDRDLLAALGISRIVNVTSEIRVHYRTHTYSHPSTLYLYLQHHARYLTLYEVYYYFIVELL
jgi:hypothetical protein